MKLKYSNCSILVIKEKKAWNNCLHDFFLGRWEAYYQSLINLGGLDYIVVVTYLEKFRKLTTISLETFQPAAKFI